jgi:hypothetical protein
MINYSTALSLYENLVVKHRILRYEGQELFNGFLDVVGHESFHMTLTQKQTSPGLVCPNQVGGFPEVSLRGNILF